VFERALVAPIRALAREAIGAHAIIWGLDDLGRTLRVCL
jgi:hypothetical protein